MSQLNQQIIRARKNKGISQEQLAEASKINLRTLQRIEKGETSPHGDTLKRLSEALGISLEDLVSCGFTEDYGYIKAMHFVALVFVLLPLGNILLPVIFWLVRKDRIKDLTYFAQKLINFQITWSILTYMPFFLPGIIMRTSGGSIHLPAFIDNNLHNLSFSYPIFMYFLNTIYLILTGIFIRRRRRNFFPLSIPFIR